VPGAELRLQGLDRTSRADSAGAFSLPVLIGAELVVVVRAVGFAEDSAAVSVPSDAGAMHLFVLHPLRAGAQELPEARVSAAPAVPGIMREFYERQRQGIGSFFDRATLEKFSTRRTGDIIQATAGGVVVRSFGQSAAVSVSRRAEGGGPSFSQKTASTLNPVDLARGAAVACYSDVYLDGTLVYAYGRTPPDPLYDVNALEPSSIEGIEVYASAAQAPVKYNRTSAGCGIVLIWTRITRP
jgi:hypothetical protein